MKKLENATPDIAAENFRRLAALFPEAVTETVDAATGRTVRAVDPEALRAAVGAPSADGAAERYRFSWPGKRAAIDLAFAPTASVLRPVREKSAGRGGESGAFDSANVYVEGDNLEALKILRETYLGRVKMIYIDPPYNTGHDFVYADDFRASGEEWKEKGGERDDDGRRLFQNTEASGRFHTDWLNMIYPRLRLAKDFLSDDGVIFISIDDNEVANLRKVCDEIFGARNFIGILPRRTKSGGGSAADKFAIEHDYIIAFAKNSASMLPLFIPFDTEYLKRYAEEDEIGRYFWDTMERSSTKTRPYTIAAPDGTILSGKWFRSEERFYEDLSKGEVRFLKKADGSWSVQFKQRLAEGRKLRSLLCENEFKSLDTDLEELGMGGVFGYPKTVYLLRHLLQLSKKDDIILDFFSGSATTAHAVMQLNAEDGGKRRFILVQLPEACAEGSEASRAGYATICDIGEERIRRAGRKILEERAARRSAPTTDAAAVGPDLRAGRDAHATDAAAVGPDLRAGRNGEAPDVGFRVYRVDSANMKDVRLEPEKTEQAQLQMFADNVKEGRTAEDLLAQAMLSLGVPLDREIAEETLEGRRVFSVDGAFLVACFEPDVPESLVREIARKRPVYAVLRDSSLGSDAAMANFDQIFAAESPETVRRVI